MVRTIYVYVRRHSIHFVFFFNFQRREELWKQVIDNMTNAIVKVVDFAKQIPGLCDLSDSDQIILLKNGNYKNIRNYY